MGLTGEKSQFGIKHNTQIKRYPDGSAAVLIASRQVFREPGYEARLVSRKLDTDPEVAYAKLEHDALHADEIDAQNLDRARRRARGQLRDLALSNPMTHFVTLTLSPDCIDRYDMKAVMRKVNRWLDNQVRRCGVSYVLVPELHKDGAIHFHGLFTAGLPLVDSGTMIPPEGGRPSRPRSARQRAFWAAYGGHVVFNIPGWPYGFSTAMELYGDHNAAVGYVCKYVAKQQQKIGGRWYYHGGALRRPDVEYTDANVEDFETLPGAYTFEPPSLSGVRFVGVRTAGNEKEGIHHESAEKGRQAAVGPCPADG